MSYAFDKGDPRKVYHGMDGEGLLCGVDLPAKPYVYWCQKPMNPGNAGNFSNLVKAANMLNVPTGLDLHHPVCVTTCPMSAATQTMCFKEATGQYELTSDYSTHAIGERYCLPQSEALLKQYNDKMGAHPNRKYIALVVPTIRKGWRVLLGVAGLAFVLSMIYLLAVECMAGCIVWSCLFALVALTGVSGAYLIYADQHGGVDGMPSSGDAGTDMTIGIVCCSVSAMFLCICTCLNKTVTRAIRVVETTAACLAECRSLLLEPLLNLTARISFWLLMACGLVWLVSVGTVRKSKVYRTFTYTDEEKLYLGFSVFMFIWLNDFITAVSQYTIANAAARWYFKEGSTNCLLCRGYCNVIFHIGSLAFGSLIIAFTRPLRMIVVVLVFAGEVSDNAAAGCISKVCSCCLVCFEQFLQHLCKNAFIDMAITSKSFCAAGTNAAQLLSPKNHAGTSALMANVGATWIFTCSGLAFVTSVGSIITGYVMLNVETFNTPSSGHYVQDPIVMVFLGGGVCFVVSLCFMLVFDSISDTLFLCMAYDEKERRDNPVPRVRAAPEPAARNLFSTMFQSKAPEPKPQPIATRPAYGNDQMKSLMK